MGNFYGLDLGRILSNRLHLEHIYFGYIKINKGVECRSYLATPYCDW